MTSIGRKKRKNFQMKRDMARKLLGYSTLAGATLAMGMPSAEAAPIVLSTFGTNHRIDFDLDSVDDLQFALGGAISSSMAYVSAKVRVLNGASFALNAFNQIDKLSASQNLGLGSTNFGVGGFRRLASSFTSSSGSSTGNSGAFLNQSGYIGIKFGANRFAWLEISTSLDLFGANSLTIHDYAFSAPGEAIHVGEHPGVTPVPVPVPEPGALALLAVGLPGLYVMRRRAAKQKEIVQ